MTAIVLELLAAGWLLFFGTVLKRWNDAATRPGVCRRCDGTAIDPSGFGTCALCLGSGT